MLRKISRSDYSVRYNTDRQENTTIKHIPNTLCIRCSIPFRFCIKILITKMADFCDFPEVTRRSTKISPGEFTGKILLDPSERRQDSKSGVGARHHRSHQCSCQFRGFYRIAKLLGSRLHVSSRSLSGGELLWLFSRLPHNLVVVV